MGVVSILLLYPPARHSPQPKLSFLVEHGSSRRTAHVCGNPMGMGRSLHCPRDGDRMKRLWRARDFGIGKHGGDEEEVIVAGGKSHRWGMPSIAG